jgi:hypothetical protein
MSEPEFEPFDDTEMVMLDWLEATFPELAGGGHTGTETPIDLQDHFPFVRVNLVTGNDDRITDHSVVDVDVFAATRGVAYPLAERIRAALIGYPHRVGTSVIDYVYTEQKPRSLEWDEGNTRRFGAIYQIGARR